MQNIMIVAIIVLSIFALKTVYKSNNLSIFVHNHCYDKNNYDYIIIIMIIASHDYWGYCL